MIFADLRKHFDFYEDMLMNETIKKQNMIFIGMIALGVFLRFFVMTFGHNFDFESYCIVGEIAGNFRNVYAETGRYNYGPIFFCIQGLLYRLAHMNPMDWESTYRVLMVSVLTMTDLGIAFFVANKYSIRKAIIFFLNPVSIIITGYHNQFDNIAVLLALLLMCFYNEEKEWNRKDIGFVVLFSLSLITKHILFILPLFIILRKNLCWKKKIVFACVPPLFFLMSFAPFAVANPAALNGIINNVFLYRSGNNAPLLFLLYRIIGFPESPRILVYIGMMALVAYLTRKYSFEKQLLIYLMTMVTFASAMANQYLIIPMVALCVLDIRWFRYVYILIIGLFLIMYTDGLNYLSYIQNGHSGYLLHLFERFIAGGYMWATWILLITSIYVMYKEYKQLKH